MGPASARRLGETGDFPRGLLIRNPPAPPGSATKCLPMMARMAVLVLFPSKTFPDSGTASRVGCHPFSRLATATASIIRPPIQQHTHTTTHNLTIQDLRPKQQQNAQQSLESNTNPTMAGKATANRIPFLRVGTGLNVQPMHSHGRENPDADIPMRSTTQP